MNPPFREFPLLFPADIQEMACPAQKLPLFREGQMPGRERVEILVRDAEIRPVLQRLQRAVGPGRREMLDRFFVKEALELGHVVSGA